ncbi:hypothetical protein BB560_001502 [Smittium megazygosporum]|uniref:sulfate adenylyltransferase n=1 Tax=Smittium megazygosporum TaxID=133381 RepID=A0A2T9ZHF7_9FUNG|nr:hypothetical protein BB560_001502 [Smittium megazygosporum]
MGVPTPYGKEQRLKDLVARDALISNELDQEASKLPYIVLNDRQICDLEMISIGGFSPLEGFMNEKDYTSVVENTRLDDGTLWSIPIYLDVDHALYRENAGQSNETHTIRSGDRIALVEPETNLNLAIITVSDVYPLDKVTEATKVYGKNDLAHPAVSYLFNKTKSHAAGGSLQVIRPVTHKDFAEIRKTPAQTRADFENSQWDKIVAFQTRNPMHRAHLELTLRASDRVDGARIFVHPVVGMTKPGDIDYVTRVNVYRMIMTHYPEGSSYLSLLPLAMRMGGPKEAVLHGIVRRNYGASHLIVGRDHAGPGKDSEGNDFYGPYEAQEYIAKFESELGIKPVFFSMVTYLPKEDRYEEIEKVKEGQETLSISGTELRNRLKTGEEIPSWFSFDNVVKVLREAYA